MKQLFLGGISLGFHFYFFLAFGSLFRKILGRKEGLNRYSPLFTPVLGLFLYYGLFELLALPMTLLLVPLHVFDGCLGRSPGSCRTCSGFFMRQRLGEIRKTLAEIFKKQPGDLSSGRSPRAGSDDLCGGLRSQLGGCGILCGKYHVTSFIRIRWGDTIPIPVFLSSVFNIRYVTAAGISIRRLFAKVFHVHPMVLAKTINPVMWTFLADLVYYQLGYALFRGKREETAEKLLSDSGRERGTGFFLCAGKKRWPSL